MAENFSIRFATVNDIDDLVRLRRLMFEWMNYSDNDILNANDSNNKNYFAQSIPNKSFIGWLVFNKEQKAIASGGLVIDQHPPGPTNPSGKVGYIMNISVEPNFRKRGIAKKILREILSFLKDQNISVVSLHASKMGKELYEKAGFNPTNEMRVKISEINEEYLEKM